MKTLMELDPIAGVIDSWARGVPSIRRVWIFGSRARGNHNSQSDLDVAVELDPIGNDETSQVSFISTAYQWKAHLEPNIPFDLHLQWYDPAGSYTEVQSGVDTDGILVYERSA